MTLPEPDDGRFDAIKGLTKSNGAYRFITYDGQWVADIYTGHFIQISSGNLTALMKDGIDWRVPTQTLEERKRDGARRK